MRQERKGFTLIEILVVIAIIAILAIVVFVALNPAERIRSANNSRRATDVDSILTAVHSYIVDHSGVLPPTLLAAGTEERQLGTAGSGAAIATGGCAVTNVAALDLSAEADLGKYLKTIPIDPQGTAALTAYTIEVNANNIITVRACDAQNNVVISASR